MGMYGSRAVTLLVLISHDVINRILKLDIQTNILVYVTRCCTDLTSKVLKERTFGQTSALLIYQSLKTVRLFFFAKYTEKTSTTAYQITNTVFWCDFKKIYVYRPLSCEKETFSSRPVWLNCVNKILHF